MDMGFAREQCRTAMMLTSNNVEAATNYLLTGELPVGGQQAFQNSNNNGGGQSGGGGYIAFGTGCEPTGCHVSQYAYGDEGRSACTAIACEAALTLLPGVSTGGADASLNSATLAGIVERGVGAYREAMCTLSVAGGAEHTTADEVRSRGWKHTDLEARSSMHARGSPTSS